MEFWYLPPVIVTLLLFCIDFLAILLIRTLVERKFYFNKWWTYKYGDSIFLPLYGFFAAILIQNNHLIIGYSLWWELTLLSFGYILVFIIEYLHIKQKISPLKQQFYPSQIYHTFIFGIMFYLIAISVPAVIAANQPVWAYIAAFILLSCYVITCIRDIFFETIRKKSHKLH
jgi:hypothetical protein